MISKMLIWIDRRLDFIVILYLFLGLFWLLNGLDKFFNGEDVVNMNSYAQKYAIVDTNGTVVYEVQGVNPEGWFGVNRDAQTIGYFERLGMPASWALGALYSIAVVEVLLGLAFLSILFYKPLLPKGMEKALEENRVFATRTIHRLAFKVSCLIFVGFMTMDILFGDRTELWEHGTFLVLTVLTYGFYIDHELIESVEEEQIAAGEAIADAV
jgi:uncharacterized membrane protein YphA (DoxX/SURF4 family)